MINYSGIPTLPSKKDWLLMLGVSARLGIVSADELKALLIPERDSDPPDPPRECGCAGPEHRRGCPEGGDDHDARDDR